jgi:hypothetical protein
LKRWGSKRRRGEAFSEGDFPQRPTTYRSSPRFVHAVGYIFLPAGPRGGVPADVWAGRGGGAPGLGGGVLDGGAARRGCG